MSIRGSIAAVASTLVCASALAQSPFDGTWRLDPERPGSDSKPQVIQLLKGDYACRACSRPEAIKADGRDHRVYGAALYDTLKVAVLNDHTVLETGKAAGLVVTVSTLTVSSDGSTLTDHQSLSLRSAPQLDFLHHFSRVSPGAKGSHAVSGTWRLTDSQLTNHGDDTTYHVKGGTVSMSDGMGQSFSAKLDGTDAPYHGSAVFTSVSVKQIDGHTLIETDKRGTAVVRITTSTVDADGATMQVRFDNHGRVVQTTAHKLQ